MSHFTVLVIGEKPFDQLAPYDEERQVEPYEEEVDFEVMKEYYVKKGKVSKDATPLDLVPYMKDWVGGEGFVDDEGTLLRWCTYNPDSKWDWYQVGGRWRGFFTLKEGIPDRPLGEAGVPEMFSEKEGKEAIDYTGKADQVRKGDIDLDAMYEEAYQNGLKTYDKAMKDSKDIRAFMYNMQEGETKEEYARRCQNNALSTFAYVKDGEWYEKGTMGWWAVVSDPKACEDWDKQFHEAFEALPDDTLLTLVDCHI